MPFVSYAQNYEDVMLWRALRDVQNGFYIDVGANHPDEESVTKAFYERGWTGINIEPIRQWYELLAKKRVNDTNLLLAAGSSETTLKIYEVKDTGLSTINREVAMFHKNSRGFDINEHVIPVKTLSNILSDLPKRDIHFLKIDVEGAEKQVLEGMNFKEYRPWIVLIESIKADTQVECHMEWEKLLLNSNYKFVYFDGLNRFFLAEEKSELKKHFIVPPNVLDDFTSIYHVNRFKGEDSLYRPKFEKLESEYQQILSAYTNLSNEYSEITNSFIWKATKPLRRLIGLLRSF